MKVNEVRFFMDGGSCLVLTDTGSFLIDGSLNSETRLEVYSDWVKNGGYIHPPHVADEVFEALSVYSELDTCIYKKAITNLINERNHL
jgi:hypothetical protein